MFESFHQSVQGDFKPAFYNPFRIKRRRRTTTEQYAVLEAAYQDDPKPLASERAHLAARLEMTPRAVQIWFQNRRAKARHTEQRQPALALGDRRHSMPHMAPADLPFRELQEAIFGPGVEIDGAGTVRGTPPEERPRASSEGSVGRKRRAERPRALQIDELFAPEPAGLPRVFGGDMDSFLVPLSGAPGVKTHHPASLSVMLCPVPASPPPAGLPAEYFSNPFGGPLPELGGPQLMYGLPSDGPSAFRVAGQGPCGGSRASSPGAAAGGLLGEDSGLDGARLRPHGAPIVF